MNAPWFIVADDFTGAGDSAVQFRSEGRPSLGMVRELEDCQGRQDRLRQFAPAARASQHLHSASRTEGGRPRFPDKSDRRQKPIAAHQG